MPTVAELIECKGGPYDGLLLMVESWPLMVYAPIVCFNGRHISTLQGVYLHSGLGKCAYWSRYVDGLEGDDGHS